MSADTLFWLIACHFIGDYTLQSDWMAQNKRANWWAALWHAHVYSAVYVFLVTSGWSGVLQLEAVFSLAPGDRSLGLGALRVLCEELPSTALRLAEVEGYRFHGV